MGEQNHLHPICRHCSWYGQQKFTIGSTLPLLTKPSRPMPGYRVFSTGVVRRVHALHVVHHVHAPSYRKEGLHGGQVSPSSLQTPFTSLLHPHRGVQNNIRDVVSSYHAIRNLNTLWVTPICACVYCSIHTHTYVHTHTHTHVHTYTQYTHIHTYTRTHTCTHTHTHTHQLPRCDSRRIKHDKQCLHHLS